MSRATANLLLFVAAALWGISDVLKKLMLDDLGPWTASGLRCAIASLVLLPAVISEVRRVRPKFNRASLVCAAMIAASSAASTLLSQIAMAYTLATDATFLNGLTTIFAPLLGWLLWRQKVRPLTLAAVATALLGAYCMAGGAVSVAGKGNALAIAAAACEAAYFVASGRLLSSLALPRTVTVLPLLTTVLALPAGFAIETISLPHLIHALPILAFGAIGSLAIGGLLASIGLRHAPTADATVIMSSEAVFAAVTAQLLLGESLSGIRLVGAGLLTAGILMIGLQPQLTGLVRRV